MASLTDPRFKTRYIEDDKLEAVKSRAVAQMLDEFQTTSQDTSHTSSSTTAVGRGDAHAAATPAKVHKKTRGSFFKKSHSVATSGLTDEQAIEAELTSYLLAPDADSETEPLAWWQKPLNNLSQNEHPRKTLPVYSCDKLTLRACP